MESMLSKAEIPIIDLTGIETNDDVCLRRSASQLHRAFCKRGLALLINHGVSEDKIRAVNEAMYTFCSLPEDVKKQYVRLPSQNHGYVPPGLESLTENKMSEARECFDVRGLHRRLPEKEIPEIITLLSQLTEDLRRLTMFLLKCLAIGLDLHEDYFVKLHSKLMEEGSGTSLRMLFYPPLSESLPSNLTRCGEHTDYGTFTLLMQDSEGGLEIMSPNHRWSRVGHLPGAILVNSADLLAAWTSGKYSAVQHRVVVPLQKQVRSKGRHSIAFFVHPDDDTVIAPIDKSEQQAVFTAKEHLDRRFKETFNY